MGPELNLDERVNEQMSSGETTLDRLAGDWWIYQLRYGHRYATDDVLTAWIACAAVPTARRVLDLGSGVGALGLLTLLRLGETARLTAVEAQAESVKLMRKTLAWNDLVARVEVREADLRDAGGIPPGASYDLITANPPYLSPASSLRSPHPQRAAARLELRGSVFDYCRVAARHLTREGRFCFCHRAVDGRAEAAVVDAGLTVLARRGVVFREGRPPLLALFTCGRDGDGPRGDPEPLVLRDHHGERTEAYRAVRRAMLIEE